MNLNEKLAKLTTNEASGWKEKAEWRKQNRSWLKKSAHVALTVIGELRRRGMTQKELAEKMGLSAQQVNKIVKGQENLTLETLDKLERALNIQLLHDGKREQMTFLNFGQLPVLQKHSVGLFYNHVMEMDWIIAAFEKFDPKPMEIQPIRGKLHVQYPVAGKEKWLQIHSERS